MEWTTFLDARRTDDPTRWLLPVTDAVTGGAGQLFGGCGLGAAVALLEELTGRPAAWATAQFVSNAFPPEVVELDATVVADGRNFCQARVVGPSATARSSPSSPRWATRRSTARARGGRCRPCPHRSAAHRVRPSGPTGRAARADRAADRRGRMG